MSQPEHAEDSQQFRVVRNDEEQFSLWPMHKPLPAGWYEEGTCGPRAVCLEHIERVWTDMRPKSVRERSPSTATSERER